MAHINFHSLAAPERKRHTRTFTDPGLPGLELVLTLLEPDALTDYAAAEVAIELVKRYIEGDDPLGMAAQPFMVGDEARPLSPILCDDAARIFAMQPEPPEYQPEEILQMAFKARGMWLAVRRWSRELYMNAEASLPNGSGTQEGDFCVPSSNEASSIPPSSTTSAGRSGASMPASRTVIAMATPEV